MSAYFDVTSDVPKRCLWQYGGNRDKMERTGRAGVASVGFEFDAAINLANADRDIQRPQRTFGIDAFDSRELLSIASQVALK